MSAPQAGAPTPGERDREAARPYRVEHTDSIPRLRVYHVVGPGGVRVSSPDGTYNSTMDLCLLLNEAHAAARAEGHASGLEAARNEEREALRRIAVEASALGDCECSEEIGELCNRCALVDMIGRRIAAIRALAGAQPAAVSPDGIMDEHIRQVAAVPRDPLTGALAGADQKGARG